MHESVQEITRHAALKRLFKLFSEQNSHLLPEMSKKLQIMEC